MPHAKWRYILAVSSLFVIAAVAGIGKSILDRRPDPVTLEDQTPIQITLDQALRSDRNKAGDRFDATVSQPVVVNDRTVIPQGSRVKGLVVDAHPSGRLMGGARLQLALETVELDGKPYPIRTFTSLRVGGNHKKRNWAWIAGGGGGGALIGALAGGGKGALIGGPVGAGAGTAVAFMTGKKDIHLAPETPLTFRLAEPVTIDLKG